METPTPIVLRLDGMSCMHCVRAVRDALATVDGVAVEDVAVGTATVTATPDWEAVRPQVATALEEAGYPLA